ncbi:cyclase family protein [Mastigocoleus sp. MO_188.B34]|uniref:cyclase family protein n=1 Tax=Mastigocoleus sp. MO_188.B34 TaxID=3036635 RepID=UPI00262E2558|nr:cyclase family protein [Mastigocoleus sp. MO_188.B34]MDJ0694476.1 cyclase family protein [Mastigocoleus sp. MO_188.B34]
MKSKNNFPVSTRGANNLLDIAKSYLVDRVAPIANDIDSNPDSLLTALKGLGELGLLALKVPHRWGGEELGQNDFSDFQELVARYSGALAFLQTQHQSAGSMLVNSSNSHLQEDYLPYMGTGELLVGVGFSQLRRQGKPLTEAIAVPGGYQLDGFVPWVTGYGYFHYFIVAATLSDGRAVFGVVPFQGTQQQGGGSITFSDPASLAAMTSTNTVSATLNSWFLALENVVAVKAPSWINHNDHIKVLKSTPMVIGCALAGLDLIESTLQKKPFPFIQTAFESLNKELRECRQQIREISQQPADVELSVKLKLRAWSIDLAARIAHACVTVSSGAANYTHHNAQRIYREALVFTVTGQTSAVMEATLARLTRNSNPTFSNLKQNTHKTEITAKTRSKITSKSSQNFISYSRVIHLSHTIDTGIPQWEGDPPVEFETVANLTDDGYYLRRFSMGEHSATHVNAPNSFHLNGMGIDKYPADSLVLPAVVIDARKQALANPDYKLTLEDVFAWETQNGEIPSESLVLLNTAWKDKWGACDAFLPQDPQGNLHFPGFSLDAVHFLLEKRLIAGVGIDTHGVDSGNDKTFAVNHLVLEKPRIVLENLSNLEQLSPTGTTLVIGVLRLSDGSGSPAGVLAFCNS